MSARKFLVVGTMLLVCMEALCLVNIRHGDPDAPLKTMISVGKQPSIMLSKKGKELLCIEFERSSFKEAPQKTFTIDYLISIPDSFVVQVTRDFFVPEVDGGKKEIQTGYFSIDNSSDQVRYFKPIIAFTLKGKGLPEYTIRLDAPAETSGQYNLIPIDPHHFYLRRQAAANALFRNAPDSHKLAIYNDEPCFAFPDDFFANVVSKYGDTWCIEDVRCFFPPEPW